MNDKPGLFRDREDMTTKIGVWLFLAIFAWTGLLLMVLLTVGVYRMVF